MMIVLYIHGSSATAGRQRRGRSYCFFGGFHGPVVVEGLVLGAWWDVLWRDVLGLRILPVVSLWSRTA